MPALLYGQRRHESWCTCPRRLSQHGGADPVRVTCPLRSHERKVREYVLPARGSAVVPPRLPPSATPCSRALRLRPCPLACAATHSYERIARSSFQVIVHGRVLRAVSWAWFIQATASRKGRRPVRSVGSATLACNAQKTGACWEWFAANPRVCLPCVVSMRP